MITRSDLKTSIGKLIVAINDHADFPDVTISIEKDDENFILAVVELDEFDKNDMSISIKSFGNPRHGAPTHELTIFDETLSKCAAIKKRDREKGTNV